MNFLPLETLKALGRTEYEKEFIEMEYEAGLPYYLARLDRLMFSGQRVLDAGCGVGQWTVALAQRFEQVESIDLKEDRLDILATVVQQLGVTNVRWQQGSIEQLPYPDDCFDAIFCYGVLMFTQVEKTLAEFYRVLAPGGRVYICLNADGWSKFLIQERGLQDENALQAGRDVLYNTYWNRAVNHLTEQIKTPRALAASMWVSYEVGKSFSHKRFLRLLYRLFKKQLDRLGQKIICDFLNLTYLNPTYDPTQVPHILTLQVSPAFATAMLQQSPKGQALWNDVAATCGELYLQRLVGDMQALLIGGSDARSGDVSRAYQPAELQQLAEGVGFCDFQWAGEAQLMCDWVTPAEQPKYAAYFRGELSVWECLLLKPQTLQPDVGNHWKLAHQAQSQPVFWARSAKPLLSSGSFNSYPPYLLEHAKQVGQMLGGEQYLKHLAKSLVQDSTDEIAVVRDIIAFVQQAIFRDPVAQPLEPQTGALPDPLTILISARGRCGHIAKVLVALFNAVGLDARILQLKKHIAAEVKLTDRWVIVDADAFKHGIIPVNQRGEMLTLEELTEHPYQLDRFPATGWMLQPGSRFTQGIRGEQVNGYVDALPFEQRGYTSGYYVPAAWGYPPSLPVITQFEAHGQAFILKWTSSVVQEDTLVGYRVRVGTRSRGWCYDNPGYDSNNFQMTAEDVVNIETKHTEISGSFPSSVSRLFASVTPVTSRIEKEAETYFWPSKEAICDLA
ncbi:hypothetical protein BST81_21210 [Leptolyngbya sp. 'hensonii']|uniref:methyltransferase domain-containing protein n=1 Tax=Leptolyngbya sp. 'hensonii' TaxID=1922337 RepID=UPI000950061A|nr:methyltransferase domain-containing protein [Leptolyngbya sp. 'hensonii']OLP16499.1 hypothetical protein BST81_21210 [Leptolyngbya sp. 'hensonii']